MIDIVSCTDQRYLDFFKDELNLTMSPDLVAWEGLPVAFLYIDEHTQAVLGMATLVDAQMRSQIDPDNVIDNHPWLIGLVVKETHRNQGIGSGLVNSILEYSQDKYTDINFNTESAQKFYQKHWNVQYLKTAQLNDNGTMVDSDYFIMNVEANIHTHDKKTKLKL